MSSGIIVILAGALISISSCGSKVQSRIDSAFANCFGKGAEDESNLAQGQSSSVSGFDKKPKDSTQGSARIFERDNNGPFIDYNLHLTGDETLTSSSFVTSTGDEARSKEPLHLFNYPPTDPRFREASVFANATRMLRWFESLGFDSNNEQIRLGVNAVIGGTINNAVYVPGTSYDPPSIYIGNGDGVVLANLSTDADVVAHDIAHHVLYRRVNIINPESLVLHEGLADFFVMIKNDDPCFARTICPLGTTINCSAPQQCLRNADNDLTYPGIWNQSPQFRGQVVSGMLWDLRISGGISREELIRLVFDSINFLPEGSNVQQFIDALHFVDDKNFNGRHRQLIADAAKKRKI